MHSNMLIHAIIKLKSTPKQDNYRMPGEFEPHEKTWMAWPTRPDNWRLNAKYDRILMQSVAFKVA